ncbi:hypothetical protein FHG87_006060 [Trinorchestia longiramus]|nr:hypothetical protein FHG87_006060 [Trinorchestia longiramus]
MGLEVGVELHGPNSEAPIKVKQEEEEEVGVELHGPNSEAPIKVKQEEDLKLEASTVIINKYVLSVLCFTYPTIYQGWQTLVGGLLLRLLLYRSSWLPASPTPLDKAGFVSLLPSFLFFVAGIVASSKALANMSVGMFLCLHNTLCSVLYLLEVFPGLRTSMQYPSPILSTTAVSRVGVIASVFTILTALGAVIQDLDITFSESPYFWLLVSLACVAVQRLHSRIADARYTEVDRLYCSYVFSVFVLAPASLYLEEAFDVLEFPHASKLDFMAACLVVGVLALCLSLHTIKFQTHPRFSLVDASGRLLTSAVSILVFTDETRHEVAALVLANLCLGLLVPGVTVVPQDNPDNWPPSLTVEEVHQDTEVLLGIHSES